MEYKEVNIYKVRDNKLYQISKWNKWIDRWMDGLYYKWIDYNMVDRL